MHNKIHIEIIFTVNLSILLFINAKFKMKLTTTQYQCHCALKHIFFSFSFCFLCLSRQQRIRHEKLSLRSVVNGAPLLASFFQDYIFLIEAFLAMQHFNMNCEQSHKEFVSFLFIEMSHSSHFQVSSLKYV